MYTVMVFDFNEFTNSYYWQKVARYNTKEVATLVMCSDALQSIFDSAKQACVVDNENGNVIAEYYF